MKIEDYSWLEFSGSSPVELDPDLASKFIAFANEDLETEDSERARVNAISNAKRALPQRVDLLVDTLGFEHWESKEKKHFPKKLEFCAKCGIIAPRILRKLNSTRNRVEHDYDIPDRPETEDFVDVVSLFLAGTQNLIYQFPAELWLSSGEKLLDFREECHLSIKFDFERSVLLMELKELKVTVDEYQSSMANEIECLREGAGNSSERVPSEMNLEAAAYRNIGASLFRHCEKTVSVSDGQLFFDWLSFLLLKAR